MNGLPGSYKMMGAVAVILFASAMMGFAVHHLLDSGTCSTTGYTRYGPAPVCSSSSTAWAIVLPIGLPVIIIAGAVGASNIFVVLGPLFLAFGVGALTVGSSDGSSTPSAFALIFGGAFAVAGLGLLAVPLRSALKSSGPRLAPGGSARALLAIACWAAALVLAAGAASLFPSDHTTGDVAAAQRADAFFQPPVLNATDSSSLYRTDNFERTLRIARVYFGAGGRVRSLTLVPGGADLRVALGRHGLRGKEVSIDDSGGYLSAGVVALPRAPRTYALSAVDPSVPAALVSRLGAAGWLASARIDHLLATPGARGTVRWLVYPVGGGAPYRADHGAGGPITVTSSAGSATLPGS